MYIYKYKIQYLKPYIAQHTLLYKSYNWFAMHKQLFWARQSHGSVQTINSLERTVNTSNHKLYKMYTINTSNHRETVTGNERILYA